MRDELLEYYERELTYLRRMGADFARRYPKVAGRLQLEPTKADDPHVERLLEGVAFLAARVHRRIDDDLPELAHTLLDVVHPHYVRPIPAATIARFHLDPEQGVLTDGLPVAKGTQLYTRAAAGERCRFRTAEAITAWPLEVTEAEWRYASRLPRAADTGGAPFALRLVVRTLGEATWEQLSIDALRLQLVGDAPLVAALYEMLLARCTRVIARPLDGGEGIVLPPSAVEPVGFEGDASLLPFPRRSFAGYALLQDYFAFPDRFMAIRIAELARVRALAPGRAVEFVLCCEATDRADWPTLLENGVRAQTFATSCVPVVNLFEQVAEPIRLTRRVHEYPIVPDAYRRRRLEVFGIDEVLVPRPGGGEPRVFLPLHAPRRGRAEVDVAGYWTAQRRTSEWRDGGADVFLAFVDADAEPIIPDASDVTVRLTCTDGTLPHQLRIPSDGRDFEILRGAPFVRIEALLRPTPHVPPPLGGAQAWRLLSLLSLNHRSLVDEGAEALRELLRLHDFARTRAAEEQVASLVRVTSRATHARIPSPGLGMTFVRGRAVELEFDEARLAGGSLYLLASVIERFLGLYVTINSFTQCTVRARQRQRVVRAWPPRSGWKPLV